MAASSESKSATVYFGNVKAETHEGQHLFEVEVRLDEFDPNMVRVELYETTQPELIRPLQLDTLE
jgi:hypothetical protein